MGITIKLGNFHLAWKLPPSAGITRVIQFTIGAPDLLKEKIQSFYTLMRHCRGATSQNDKVNVLLQ